MYPVSDYEGTRFTLKRDGRRVHHADGARARRGRRRGHRVRDRLDPGGLRDHRQPARHLDGQRLRAAGPARAVRARRGARQALPLPQPDGRGRARRRRREAPDPGPVEDAGARRAWRSSSGCSRSGSGCRSVRTAARATTGRRRRLSRARRADGRPRPRRRAAARPARARRALRAITRSRTSASSAGSARGRGASSTASSASTSSSGRPARSRTALRALEQLAQLGLLLGAGGGAAQHRLVPRAVGAVAQREQALADLVVGAPRAGERHHGDERRDADDGEEHGSEGGLHRLRKRGTSAGCAFGGVSGYY